MKRHLATLEIFYDPDDTSRSSSTDGHVFDETQYQITLRPNADRPIIGKDVDEQTLLTNLLAHELGHFVGNVVKSPAQLNSHYTRDPRKLMPAEKEAWEIAAKIAPVDEGIKAKALKTYEEMPAPRFQWPFDPLMFGRFSNGATFYHGTTHDRAKAIKQTGLIPHRQTAFQLIDWRGVPLRKLIGEDRDSIYLTADQKLAEFYARFRAKYEQAKKGEPIDDEGTFFKLATKRNLKAKPAIVEFELPAALASKLKTDIQDWDANSCECSIPAEHVKRIIPVEPGKVEHP